MIYFLKDFCSRCIYLPGQREECIFVRLQGFLGMMMFPLIYCLNTWQTTDCLIKTIISSLVSDLKGITAFALESQHRQVILSDFLCLHVTAAPNELSKT